MNETDNNRGGANAKLILIAIAAILVAGSALRVWGLGRATLSGAEAFTLATASQPKQVLRNIYRNGGDRFMPAPLPFTLVAKNYTRADSTELAARLPGAVLGAVSLILVFLIARQIAGTGPAVLTLLFISFSPYLIRFNREFTHHSLVFFLMAASIWTCLRAIEAERPLLWCVVFGGAYLLLVMFFPVALCLFVPLNLIFFIYGPRGARDRAVWAALNGATLCAGMYFLIRWLPVLLERPIYSLVFKDFVDSRFIPVPQFFVFHFIELYFQVFGGAVGFFALDSAHPNWGHIISFLLLPVVFHTALFYGFKPFPGDEKQRTIIFFLLAFTFPISAGLLFLGMPLGEALLPVLPIFPLLLSVGVLRNDSRRFRWIFAIALFCVVAGSVPDAFRAERGRVPWREVVTYLEEKAEPGDALVILDGWIGGPFFYYAPPGLKERTHAFFPDFATRIVDDHFLQEDIVRPLNPTFDTSPPFTIARLLYRHDAVWILYVKKPLDDKPRIEQSTYWLRDNTHITRKKNFKGRFRAERLKLKARSPEDPYSTLAPQLKL